MSEDALPELRDIIAAPPPSWWPPAPGWWVLALAALLLSLFMARYIVRYQRRHQRRRLILTMLAALHRNYGNNNTVFAAEVSMLLRRVALERFPREQIAGLSGAAWLAFLDSTVNTKNDFSNGAGRVLADAPYQRQTILNADELYRLARHWLQYNL